MKSNDKETDPMKNHREDSQEPEQQEQVNIADGNAVVGMQIGRINIATGNAVVGSQTGRVGRVVQQDGDR